jgi:hypothetical protein
MSTWLLPRQSVSWAVSGSHTFTFDQATKDANRWTTVGNPAGTHQTTTTSAGDWSNIGDSHALGDPYKLSEQVDVAVSALVRRGSGAMYVVIGRGTAKCEYTRPDPLTP